jgi:hypothetical protein
VRSVFFWLPIAALIILFSLLLSGTTVHSQPRIEFDEISYDWGEASEGDTIIHAFRFKNAGDATLKVDRVKSS